MVNVEHGVIHLISVFIDPGCHGGSRFPHLSMPDAFQAEELIRIHIQQGKNPGEEGEIGPGDPGLPVPHRRERNAEGKGQRFRGEPLPDAVFFYFGTIMIPVALICFHFGIEEIRNLSSSQQNTPLSG